MPRDSPFNGVDGGGGGITERSPLLGDAREASNEGGVLSATAPDNNTVAARDGLPEVAAKLRYLIPAIGIGVSVQMFGKGNML
jgi:hypothetical protein